MEKRKKIYLTIDDGPSKDFRKKIDYLYSKKIQAIFFCRGDFLNKRRKEIMHAIKKRFVIGNHSYSHFQFSKISLKDAKNQIIKTDKIINELYHSAKIKRPMRVFRFPYGDKGGINKKAIQGILKQLGYKQPKFKGIKYSFWHQFRFKLSKDRDVFWTLDYAEYGAKNWKTIINKMNCKNPIYGGNLMNKNSSDIFLIHDHSHTTKMFFKIIEELLRRKIKFENFKE